jgi:RNA polymerase sigma factor (sigma-70 family)
MPHQTQLRAKMLEAGRQAAASPRRPLRADNDLKRIVRSASEGDASAWSELLERFTARVLAVARAHRLPLADAEDVAQTTWMRLIEHIAAVKDPKAVGAWLETTARRESLRALRGIHREGPTDNEAVLTRLVEPVAERRLVAAENREAVVRAVKRLPSRQQRLLSALFADGAKSYEEISQTLGMPIGSLGPTRARSLARLRCDEELLAVVSDDFSQTKPGRAHGDGKPGESVSTGAKSTPTCSDNASHNRPTGDPGRSRSLTSTVIRSDV